VAQADDAAYGSDDGAQDAGQPRARLSAHRYGGKRKCRSNTDEDEAHVGPLWLANPKRPSWPAGSIR
jgi:hypothetical protein